jgi:hypothetical protein
MFPYRVSLIVVFAAVIASLAGCSDDNVVNNPVNPDEAAIGEIIGASSEFEHDVVSHSVPDTTAASLAAAVERYFWWRQYTSATRTVDVEFIAADSAIAYPHATASITTTFTGQLHIVHRDTADAYTHSTKPVVDVVTQTATFEQRYAVDFSDRGWVRTELSNLVGYSQGSTLSIDALSLFPETSPDVSYTSADFADLHAPADRPTFGLDENVYIMVQAGDGTDRVFRHDWYSGGVSRTEATNQDFGYYSDQMLTPASLASGEAFRFILVDVIGEGVIDGSAAYTAYLWGIPYVVDAGGGIPE